MVLDATRMYFVLNIEESYYIDDCISVEELQLFGSIRTRRSGLPNIWIIGLKWYKYNFLTKNTKQSKEFKNYYTYGQMCRLIAYLIKMYVIQVRCCECEY